MCKHSMALTSVAKNICIAGLKNADRRQHVKQQLHLQTSLLVWHVLCPTKHVRSQMVIWLFKWSFLLGPNGSISKH